MKANCYYALPCLEGFFACEHKKAGGGYSSGIRIYTGL